MARLQHGLEQSQSAQHLAEENAAVNLGQLVQSRSDQANAAEFHAEQLQRMQVSHSEELSKLRLDLEQQQVKLCGTNLLAFVMK